MKKSKTGTEEKLFTEVELELMNLLWKIKEGSVSDVMNQLPKTRQLAYTSVSTVLRILEQKGALTTRKEGRGHIYVPAVSKSDYEAKTLRHVVDKVFEGTPVALVRQLLGSVKIDAKEIEELKEMLNQWEKN
jgi:predicted transcriptional regulator